MDQNMNIPMEHKITNSIRFLFSLILIFTAVTCIAGKNSKRVIVFTLNENEVIVRSQSEYLDYLLHSFNQNRFVCLIEDTLSKKHTFVCDGNRVQEISNLDKSLRGLDRYRYSFRIANNSYIFTHCENGKYYVNYNGTINGGFDKISFKEHLLGEISLYHSASSKLYFNLNYSFYNYRFYYKDENHRLKTPETDYDYLYKLADKWYACKNGENKTIDFVESYVEDGKLYRNTKGNINEIDHMNEEFDDEDDMSDFKLTENGNYLHEYYENGKVYININGNISGGFDEIIHDYSVFTFLGSGKYAYTYKNGEKYYININGLISEGFDWIGNVKLTKSGTYAYAFFKDGKNYVNANGNINEGGNQMISYLKLTESGNYAYSYVKYAAALGESNKRYINVNGEIVGDMGDRDNLYDLILTESGNYAYTFRIGDQDFVNINGNISKASCRYNRSSYEYSNQRHDYLFSKMILTESGNFAYIFKHFPHERESSFININGKTDGGFAEIAYYTVNDKGDYVYCYVDSNPNYGRNPPEKNRCVNINGHISCGFDYLADFTLTENGEYAYRYGKNGKHYIDTNGNIEEDTTIYVDWRTFHPKELELESNDKKHIFYSSHDRKNVLIDGEPHGKAFAVQAWYDEKKNTFIWTAVESRELVIYEYELH